MEKVCESYSEEVGPVPVAASGPSVLPLLFDTGQNHSPWTTACLEVKTTI